MLLDGIPRQLVHSHHRVVRYASLECSGARLHAGFWGTGTRLACSPTGSS